MSDGEVHLLSIIKRAPPLAWIGIDQDWIGAIHCIAVWKVEWSFFTNNHNDIYHILESKIDLTRQSSMMVRV